MFKAGIVTLGLGLAACGSDPKPAPAEPEAPKCTDAPGKIFIQVSTVDGASVCGGSTATVKWGDGKESAVKLQTVEKDGKTVCGFTTDKAGSLTVNANGFNPGAASWKAPAKCEERTIQVKLSK
jgi:hypothetical protein